MSYLMKLLVALAMALLMVGTVACGDTEETPDATEEDTTEEDTDAGAGGEVTIQAEEYKFDIPATLPAGPTTFTLVNVGEEPHFIQIQELKADSPSVAKLLKLPGNKAESFFVRQVAQTKVIQPGDTSDPFEAELTSGRYGYVCFFSEKGEPPHAFQGMAGEFTVE